ncbi:beta-nerve growth factor-like [Heptranchias perlo]|uniref:beta-nerve growth factor-like n=1 Tax=Heptranchias perlo TaxID=212740 RepID=UPI00355ABF82
MTISCCLFLTVFLSAIQASARINNVTTGGRGLGLPQCRASHTPSSHPHPGAAASGRMSFLQPFTVDPHLFRSRPFHSSRVRFHTHSARGLSTRNPSAGQPSSNTSPRIRRQAKGRHHQGQFSVCDKQHHWVMDKKVALDIHGREVQVVSHFYMNGTLVRQRFYETSCRKRRPTSLGCRGIDSRNWNSHCDTTDSHVHALVLDNNHIKWNFIRIRTACVCVLTRKPWKP